MRKKPNAPEGPARVAVYTRVSSEEQVKEHYSLETQRVKCVEKLNQVLGEDLYVATFFVDEGLPGRYGLYDPHNSKRKFRPALTAMRDAFVAGELDAICVYRMSRLWRKAASGDFVMEQFVPHGLKRLISCTENIDFKTASGRFQLNVQAAVGAYEAEQLGEWVSDALQKRLRDGYNIGWLYGWRPESDQERTPGQRRGIMPVSEQADTIREMVRRFLAGEGLRTIAKWLNDAGCRPPRRAAKWGTGVVRQVIRNPVHAGLIAAHDADGDRELVQGQHFERRLYDPDVYHRVLERLERNKTQNGRTNKTHDHLLSGVLRCGHCGRSLYARKVDRLGARIYRCSSGSQECDPVCTRNSERGDTVEGLVVAELRRLAVDPGVRRSAEASVEETLTAERASVESELAALRTRAKKLWDHYRFWSQEMADGHCERDEFEVHVADFRAQKAEAEARIKELQATHEQEGIRRSVLQRARELVADFDACWDALSMPQRRELMQAVVETATMSRLADGRTEVTFKLRGFKPVTRLIGRRSQKDRPKTGLESLTPRQQVVLYLYGQGLDRAAIAKKLGIGWSVANTQLWQARTKLGAETPEAAWEMAKDHIEANLHWLPLSGRKRKAKPKVLGGPLLTAAQCELLGLLARGKTATQAAKDLGIAASTAHVQLKNCRDRLGVATSKEAVRKAVDLGLVK